MVLGRFLKGSKSPAGRRYADFRFEYNHPVALTAEGGDEEYGTVVYDYNEAEMVIFVPLGKRSGRPLELAAGDTVSLTVPQQAGAYQGYARVTEVRTWPQELITLAVPEYWQERQDRRFFRLPVKLPLRYAPVTGRGLNPEDFHSSLTLDLSAGGAKFSVEGTHRRGDLLYVQFDIVTQGEVRSLVLTGQVVRLEESLSLGKVAAVQFTDISEREQKLLVEWVTSQHELSEP